MHSNGSVTPDIVYDFDYCVLAEFIRVCKIQCEWFKDTNDCIMLYTIVIIASLFILSYIAWEITGLFLVILNFAPLFV